MEPVAFPEQNTVLAKDQPPYKPLPAYRTEDGRVISCWRFGWLERFKILINGRIWLHQLTFNGPLQPQKLDLETPFL
jgi:hypothetical protein